MGTGLAIELAEGTAGLVVPRSGLAARHGVTLANAPGLIDSGYRGELRVILLNTDLRESLVVEPGMRIAQLVVIPLANVRLRETAELPVCDRGGGGLGSSGA